MTDLGVLLESMSSVFNKSTPDNSSVLDLHEDKTLKWRSLHNNQSASKKKGGEGQQQQQQQQQQTNNNSSSTIASVNYSSSSSINSSGISNTSNSFNNSSSSNNNSTIDGASNNNIKICKNNENFSQKEDAAITSNNGHDVNLIKTSSDTIKINNMKSDQNKKIIIQENNSSTTSSCNENINTTTSSSSSEKNKIINDNNSKKKNTTTTTTTGIDDDGDGGGKIDTNIKDEKFDLNFKNSLNSIQAGTAIISTTINTTTTTNTTSNNLLTTTTTGLVATTAAAAITTPTTTTTGTKRTRSSEPSPSERCLRRSRPNEVTTNTSITTASNELKSSSIVTNNSSQQQQLQQQPQVQQQQQQPRRRGRSKKIPPQIIKNNDDENLNLNNKNILNDDTTTTATSSSSIAVTQINQSTNNNDGPTNGPKKLRRNHNKNELNTIIGNDNASGNDTKKLDLDDNNSSGSGTKNVHQQQLKHKTRRSTRLEVKLDSNTEETNNDTKDNDSITNDVKEETAKSIEWKKNNDFLEELAKHFTRQQVVAEKTPKKRGRRAETWDTKENDSITTDVKEETTESIERKKSNDFLEELAKQITRQQAVVEKTPKKRGRRAKIQHQPQQQQQEQPSPNNNPETNVSSHTSPDSTTTTIDGMSIVNTSISTTTQTTPTTSTLSKTINSKQLTKENTSIPQLTSQRPLRRIKPTPKILENDELRYEFETKNIARITACTEMHSNELESTKPSNNSNNSNGKKDLKDSTVIAGSTAIATTTTSGGNSTGKASSSSSVCSDRYTSGNTSAVAVNDVKKKLFAKKNGNSIHSTPIIYPPIPDKKPCPDPEVFLNEIKAAKLNLNRSPEDKKLNRKQHRRLLKQKEKHLEKLGLRRNTKDEPSESEISSGEDEFVPANSKKINVGKTNVTLRVRTTSSKECNKDASPIRSAPGPSKLALNSTATNKYHSHSNLSKQQQQQLQQQQHNASTATINQILKQQQQSAMIKQSCSIPISTTGSVTITPITTGTAATTVQQRKKRNQNQTLISQTNSGSASLIDSQQQFKQQQQSTKDNSIQSSQSQSDHNQKNLVTTVVPNVVISTKIQMPENLICLCQKQSHYYTRNIPGTAYCCAIDNIEEQKVGCCNQLSGELLNLLRPSQRIGYMILCDDHLKRLRAHNCCANCGMFCTQGKFVLCQQKHFFHAECAQKFILSSPFDPTNTTNYASPTLVLKCPHCGQDTPEKTSIVTMKCQTLPVFLPSQKALNKPAKMSVSDGQQPNQLPKRKLPVCVELENLIPESVMNVVVREANSVPNNSSEFTSRDMFYAVNNDDLERVAEILASRYNITCEMTELLNGTCLHLVAHFGTVQMAYLLLCRESSNEFLNLVDKELRTALMCSIIGDKIDILKLLIQCGANLTLKGPDGMTCLHIAAKLGNVGAAQLIVENHKNNTSICKFDKFINSQDDGGWTAIVWAAELGFTEIVSLLLNYGANPNICDAENNSVLHWATLSNHVDTISVLLRSNIDCSIQNITGDTPLHIACRTSSTRVCLMLIANGADLMVKNKAGELPYDCIESEDNQCARAVGFNMQMRSFGSTGLKNKIICSDISNGRETNPIQVIKRDLRSVTNDSVSGSGSSSMDLSGNCEVDEIMLPDFKYITKSILLQNSIQIDQRVSQMRICNCNDGCNSEQCQCSTMSIQNWYTPEGRLIGEFNYDDPAMIFECNDVCGCNKLICKNRVVQNGLKIPLQIYECEERIKGWGVRTLINIPRGTFVAEYTGEILTDLEADRRTDDSYFFDLGVSEHCIDANFYGNLSRFFNHSCVPNIVPVRVYYDHQDYRFPKIAFFASKDISSGEELCFDYGEKFWSIKQKYFTCKCLYPQCRYSKLITHINNNNSKSTIITATTSSSSTSSSLLSSLSSATSRIPAGTTITTITTTTNMNNNNSNFNYATNGGGSNTTGGSNNNNSNTNNKCSLNNNNRKHIPNVSIVL